MKVLQQVSEAQRYQRPYRQDMDGRRWFEEAEEESETPRHVGPNRRGSQGRMHDACEF